MSNFYTQRNNRILIIVACLMIGVIAAGGVFLDSFVWAQPEDAAETASEMTETVGSEEDPMDNRLVIAGNAAQDETAEEKLYLRSSDLILESLEEGTEAEPETEPEAEPEPQPEPLPEGESSGFVTVGLYSSCSSVSKGAVSEINITCADGFYLAKVNDRGYAPDTDYRDYTAFVVRIEDGVVNLYDTDGNVVATGLCADDVLISAAEDPDSRLLTVGTAQYRDGVMFRVESGSRMAVINFVKLEHYLWGTLHSEMSAVNPIEALKAQAVACRSFAVSHYGYHGKYGFDLCTSTNCQVYKGVSAEKESTVRACKETAGIVMTSGGKVASGYFYASSGGYTMNSEDVWGGTISYCRAVADPYAPMKAWNTSFTFEELSSKLKSKGYNVGNIKDVAITSYFANGAVKTLTITGDAGSAVLNGSYEPSNKSIVSVLGSSNLQSVFFSLSQDLQYEVTYEDIETVVEVPVETVVTTEAVVVDADGSAESVDLSDAAVIDADGTVTTEDLTEAVAVDTDAVKPVETKVVIVQVENKEVTGGTVYFTGYGYGHGVGMPQTSAIAMASAGHNYEEILTYYYTGIQLTKLSSL